MPLTLEVFQLPIFLLNELALANIVAIEVTVDVSQLPMSWLNELALSNILLRSVTPERSGLSDACPATLLQPQNAFAMDVHLPVPHCSIVSSFGPSPPLLK